MNKYERLFNEILDGTRDGRLKWKQLNRRANADVIFNPNLVFRQFSAELKRDDSEFTVLFVEKKYEDPDFDFPLERYTPELLVLEEGELVTNITDSIVGRGEMRKLADLVETRSDKATRLFGRSKAGKLLDKIGDLDSK
jgi:hypothetical protein